MFNRLFGRKQSKNEPTTEKIRQETSDTVCMHCRGSGYEPRMVGVHCRVCGGTGKGQL